MKTRTKRVLAWIPIVLLGTIIIVVLVFCFANEFMDDWKAATIGITIGLLMIGLAFGVAHGVGWLTDNGFFKDRKEK